VQRIVAQVLQENNLPEGLFNFLPVNFPEQRSSGDSCGFRFRKDSVGDINF